jgi:Cu/Ag efflux protein CusF
MSLINRKAQATTLAAALALGACTGAIAQQPAANTSSGAAVGPGQAVMADVVKTTATVVAIDSGTRAVTLKRQDGKVITITAGDEVRNFAQLKVGDRVEAEYGRALALELRKGSGTKSNASETAATLAAPQGQKPAGAAVREVTVLADVVAVDVAAKVVTLRGPAGNQIDLQVRDPAQLANIKKGDQVQAVYTESFAIKVSAAPAKEGEQPKAKAKAK